jgi:hypothetical protein
MPHDFKRRAAGLAGNDGTQLCRCKTLEIFDLRDFPEPSPPSNVMYPGVRRAAAALPGSCSELLHSRGTHLMTSSLAPSIARRMVEPVPTASAAKTGDSTAMLALRHTLRPTGWPARTGARTGPL